MARRVAVVGAGYAGMAAAVSLSERGIPVTVFESGPVPGGRARRVDLHGHALDNGQHILIGAYAQLFRLMRTVGVPSDALLRVPLELRYAAGFAFRALWLPPPFGMLAGLLLARGVPLRERLGAVRFVRALKRRTYELPEDMTVSELLREHAQGSRIGRYLWEPLCVSALNTPVDVASARAFLTVLRETLGGPPGASDLVLPRADLSRLFPEPAAEFVARRGGEVRLRCPVRSLRELEDFEAVIVAVAPHQLNALLPDLPLAYSYQPVYTCYMQYAQTLRLPFPMLGLTGGLVQWVFDRGALLGERGRLACVISAQGEHQKMTLEELCERCHRELAAAIPGLAAPLWSRAIAEKRATITCSPGVKRPPLAANGVFLAGDYTDPMYPPTLEAAVRSGVRAAGLIDQSSRSS
ncbi:MAG TPA: hydroxysqualene dehydroxylase HpnE [Burkholderiales bacterium]|jgi:squalene-associated FAD-dependent desaturase|nr:hydroxysqualene dehydroxylase HpnE [Burkholderiales bacterium]